MHTTAHTFFRAALVCLTLALAACGYYNPYVARSNSKPITLHRSMWTNQTNELGLETTFYHALSDCLRKSKAITLTDSRETADYDLTGRITSVDYPEISYGGTRDANELRANIIIDFAVTDNATGKVVWRKSNYLISETLSTSTDPSQLQANKKAALAAIADEVAEGIYLHFINSIMLPSE